MAKFGNDDIKRRVSYAKKVANDFQRQKDWIDAIDQWIGDYRDYGDIKNMKVNYGLANGRLDTKMYGKGVCVNIGGEEVKLSHHEINHYPLTSQIFNAMYGEGINRPFQPIAKHLGAFAHTLKSRKWNELIKELIDREIMAPLWENATQSYLQAHQIQDQFSLSPEEMQQMQSDIQNRVASNTPEEILDFFENDYQTPTQRQAQQFLDYFVEHLDIRYKQQEGFKHAIITGQEIYYIGDRHGQPTFELINPVYFTWYGSQNTEWIQKGEWTKYEEWNSYSDITNRYAEKLRPSHYKYLEESIEPIGGVKNIGKPNKDPVQSAVMYEFGIEDGFFSKKYGKTDIRTREGQRTMLQIYEDVFRKYGADYGYAMSNYGIREAHVTFRDKRKFKRVTKLINGEEKKFWQDEHYETQPDDVEVVEVWVDENWEGRKIGFGENAIYVDIRPVPGQFKSIFNPFGTDLPYYGKLYNTHMNNTKNVSPIDLAKPWQLEFDTTMAQIRHHLATDVGKVFLIHLQLKPDDTSWKDWLNTMKNSKLMLSDPNKLGYQHIDPNFLRPVDLSSSSDIAQKIEYAEYCRNNLIMAMNFNAARIGAVGEYATNRNIEAGAAASFNQTESYFETHRQIVEKAINGFMNRVRFLYRNDVFKKEFILDDVARMELEISPDFWYEEIAVEFSTSTEDIRRIEALRQQLLSFIQNGMSFDGILELTLAKTPSDIISILKKENKRIEQIRQENINLDLQKHREDLESRERSKQAELQQDMYKFTQDLLSKERRSEMESQRYAYQYDINKNQISDSIERALLEIASREKLAKEERQSKERMAEKDRKLEEKELQIKEKALDKKPSK